MTPTLSGPSSPRFRLMHKIGAWYDAEEYHQNYFERNPNQGYCRVVIVPKVAKLRQHYLDKLK